MCVNMNQLCMEIDTSHVCLRPPLATELTFESFGRKQAFVLQVSYDKSPASSIQSSSSSSSASTVFSLYMFQATSDCATLHHTRINFCHATSRATKVAPMPHGMDL